jgi:hypothetical protein
MKTVLIKTTDEQGVMYSLSGENLPENYVLSLKNCQAIENGYNLDELTIKFMDEFREGKEFHTNQMLMPLGFNKGFQKALEILGDKKFSEEDMRKAAELSRDFKFGRDAMDYTTVEFQKSNSDIIQSLQQTEWEVEIVEEDSKVVESHIWDGSNDGELTWKKQLLFDADGYLILKRKI